MRKRRKASQTSEVPEDTTTEPHDTAAGTEAAANPRVHGPWDSSELPVEEDDATRADLGSLSVEGHPEVELRLQVDETSGQVGAVMLIGSDGAMELRAFAAPRREDLWEEIRPQLAAEATRRGGTVTEVEGPYGTALHLVVPGVTPDGKQVTQPSTVLGIAGPRWLLRVSMFGRPAVDYRPDELLETTLRSVVVNRGSGPMAPGDALPLTLPAGAKRVDSPSGPS